MTAPYLPRRCPDCRHHPPEPGNRRCQACAAPQRHPDHEQADRERRAERYRRGVCTDCGQQPHSAGRPRCNDCHAELVRLRAQGWPL